MDKDYIISEAERVFGMISEARRFFHANPELGRNEFNTQKYIIEFLDAEKIEHKSIADTGVIAVINGRAPGKTVALRGDMDALPLREEESAPFRSKNEGVMHACGHDAHTAIALGCAKIFHDNKDKFDGTVKIFFQPDEEGDGGAERMILEGCLETPHVDHVIGLHVYPELDFGKVEVSYGPMNAAVDTLQVIIRGAGGHGAHPENCTDAILIAAQVIVSAQSIISRNISAADSAVISIGMINGGTASNIIADKVELVGTIRSAKPEVREHVHEQIKALVTGIARAYGGDAEVVIEEGYPALINHSRIVDIIAECATECLGEENVSVSESMSMGAEDFSYFTQKTEGAFYNIGCNTPGAEPRRLHTSGFQIDERCLKTGMIIQTAAALRLLCTDFTQ